MSDQPQALKPRKAPRQKRSIDTCNVILEATAELICKRGLDSLTTNRIAERAGVSIGSLYQYFPGRDAILASLIREMRRSMLQDFQTAVSQQQQQSLDAEIEALVSAALKHHFNNPTLARWLEKAEEDLPLDAQTQELKQEMAKLVTDVLARHAVPEPQTTAFDLVAMSHGMMHAATQAGQSNIKNMQQRVLRAVRGYVANL